MQRAEEAGGSGCPAGRGESPPGLGAAGSARPPSDSAGPGPPGHRAQLPATAPKAFVRALPARARGSPGDPRLRRDGPGRQRKGGQPVPAPGSLPAALRRSPGSPPSGTRSEAAGMSTDPARSPDRRVRAGEKESKVSARTRRVPRAAGRPQSAAAAGPAPGAPPPCAHPAGPQPREVCAAGPARGPSGAQPAVAPSGGRGAGGRARRGPGRAAPGGGGSGGRRERPALTLSQQAPSSTNSRQNSYSRESAPLPAARSARAQPRETRAGREWGGGARRPLSARAAPLRHNSPGVGTAPLSREPGRRPACAESAAGLARAARARGKPRDSLCPLARLAPTGARRGGAGGTIRGAEGGAGRVRTRGDRPGAAAAPAPHPRGKCAWDRAPRAARGPGTCAARGRRRRGRG